MALEGSDLIAELRTLLAGRRGKDDQVVSV